MFLLSINCQLFYAIHNLRLDIRLFLYVLAHFGNLIAELPCQVYDGAAGDYQTCCNHLSLSNFHSENVEFVVDPDAFYQQPFHALQ